MFKVISKQVRKKNGQVVPAKLFKTIQKVHVFIDDDGIFHATVGSRTFKRGSLKEIERDIEPFIGDQSIKLMRMVSSEYDNDVDVIDVVKVNEHGCMVDRTGKTHQYGSWAIYNAATLAKIKQHQRRRKAIITRLQWEYDRIIRNERNCQAWQARRLLTGEITTSQLPKFGTQFPKNSRHRSRAKG